MSDRIRLGNATLNAPDALALARFYATITGSEVRGSEAWASVSGPDCRLEFQQDEGFRPVTWPRGDRPMQAHLEFEVDDLDATEARVLAAGATRYDVQPNDHCRVFADPAGHPFCLSTWAGLSSDL